MDYLLLAEVLMVLGAIFTLTGMLVETQEITSAGMSAMLVSVCILLTILFQEVPL